MKIFNIENDIKKVYVQKKDLIMLIFCTDLPIPISISIDFLKEDINPMDFVEFTQPDEIDFFKKLDWIIDYKQIRNLSEEEIKEKKQEIIHEMIENATKFNSIPANKSYNQSIIQKQELLDYKIKHLSNVLSDIQNNKQLPIPDVPDSDGFSYEDKDDPSYEVRSSLNPNKILFFRKDRKNISNETVSFSFIQKGVSYVIKKLNKNIYLSEDYEPKTYLTKDNSYFVIEFKYKNRLINNNEQKKAKTRFIKRIFNKNKQ